MTKEPSVEVSDTIPKFRDYEKQMLVNKNKNIKQVYESF